MKERTDLTIAGRRLHAERLVPRGSASSPTLVFLHEALGSIPQWKEFPATLCRLTGLPGLVYERWGFGQSEGRGPGPWPADYLEGEADALAALLEATGIEKPVLFGHSDGGTIALFFAANYPERAAAIVAEAAHVLVEEVTLEGIRETVALFAERRLLGRLSKYHGDKAADVFSGWADTWLAPTFRDWNMTGKLRAIRTPALVLQGEDDKFGTRLQVETIGSSVSGPVDCKMLAGCGHVPHLEATDKVVAEVTTFLRSHSLLPGRLQ